MNRIFRHISIACGNIQHSVSVFIGFNGMYFPSRYRSCNLWLVVLTIASFGTSDASAQIFSHGTFIVAKVMPDTVIVAADSRMRTSDNSFRADTACKICTHGKTLIAISGTSYGVDNSFNLWKIAYQASSPKNTLDQTVKDFVALAKKPLRAIMSRATNDTTASVVFAQWEGGRPRCKTVGFVLRQIGPTTDSLFVRIDSTSQIIGGAARQVYQHLRTFGFSRFWTTYGLVGGASTMVEWAKAIDPSNIGGDVDILCLDKSGLHWIRQKDICKQRK
jgi:hypothetical protein